MKTFIVTIVIGAVLLGGAVVFLNKSVNQKAPEAAASNVTVVDGKQIIEITAKGGYLPRQTMAKADLPTILRFNTKGTFDCSSVVRIPSMDISKNLPASGVTDIDIGSQKVATLQGTCGMGMYPFEVTFN
ncbi:MAG: cupredoxin domain-containing protein [Candidatus Buchananbacteria bacterium]|nr:cupredoxin domain-containing protein [Candidatus Buchananbacteria bacterium]